MRRETIDNILWVYEDDGSLRSWHARHATALACWTAYYHAGVLRAGASSLAALTIPGHDR